MLSPSPSQNFHAELLYVYRNDQNERKTARTTAVVRDFVPICPGLVPDTGVPHLGQMAAVVTNPLPHVTQY